MATLTTSWQKFSEVSIYSGSYLQVWARYTSQSIANNQTVVEAQLRIHNNSGTGYNCYTHSCNFNGGTFTASDYQGSYYHGWGAGDHTLLSQSLTLTHNQDGTLSFNIGGYFTCSAGIGGTVPVVNITVPKINRISLVTLSKSNFNVGETIKASITQYVSSYRQDLYIDINGTETLIQSSATGEITIDTSTYASAIYAATPTSKYLDGTFKLKTYNGSTLIGTDTKSYRANIVNSEPIFDVGYKDNNNTTTAITQNNQQIIQNKSIFQVNITNATALNNATLSTYKIEILGISSTGSISTATKNINIGTLNTSSNTVATITITDSRGFTTTKTLNVTILEWHIPNAIISLQRKQNFYTETDINVDANYSSLDSKNTITIEYRYKKTSDNTWSNWSALSDNVTTTFNADNTYSWDVEVRLTDAIDSYTYTGLYIGVGIPTAFIDKKRNSLGIFCIPQYDNSIEVNGVDISNTYDINERPIGRWSDGKPVYRSTIEFTLNNGGAVIDISNLNIETIINYYGLSGSQNDNRPINFYVNFGGTDYFVATWFSNNKIYCQCSASYDGSPTKVHLEYTKTTD